MTSPLLPDDLLPVQILQKEDVGTFWAKEVATGQKNESAEAFLSLEKEMASYFTSENIPKLVPKDSDLTSGLVCAGLRKKGRKWVRAKVMCVMQTTRGLSANCFLLDYAATELIHRHQLRVLPDQFCRIPHQASCYRLHGIRPVTYVTDMNEQTTTLQPCNTWDTSAKQLLDNFFKESTERHLRIMGLPGEDNVIPVKLYLLLPKLNRICVNDYLAQNQYAAYNTEESDSDGISSNMNGIKKTHQYYSDGEECNRNNNIRASHLKAARDRPMESDPATPSNWLGGTPVNVVSQSNDSNASVLNQRRAHSDSEEVRGRNQLLNPVPSNATGSSTTTTCSSVGRGILPRLGMMAGKSVGRGTLPLLGMKSGEPKPCNQICNSSTSSERSSLSVVQSPSALNGVSNDQKLISEGEMNGAHSVLSSKCLPSQYSPVSPSGGLVQTRPMHSPPRRSDKTQFEPKSHTPTSTGTGTGRGGVLDNVLKRIISPGTVNTHGKQISSPGRKLVYSAPPDLEQFNDSSDITFDSPVSPNRPPMLEEATDSERNMSPQVTCDRKHSAYIADLMPPLESGDSSSPLRANKNIMTSTPDRTSAPLTSIPTPSSNDELPALEASLNGSPSKQTVLHKVVRNEEVPPLETVNDTNVFLSRLPRHARKTSLSSNGKPGSSPDSDQQGYLSNHNSISSLKRQSVSFSDVENVFEGDLSPDTSYPLPPAKPVKSIMKKSPSLPQKDFFLNRQSSDEQKTEVSESHIKHVTSPLSPDDNIQGILAGRQLQQLLGLKRASSYEENDYPPEDQGVLTYGRDKVTVVIKEDARPFMQMIRSVIHKKVEPTKLQMYTWASVLRGQDVVAVAPSGSHSGGKTLSYLPILLNQLSQKTLYTDVPVGCGPLSIIICPSSCKVKQIYEQAIDLLVNSTYKPTILDLFGGGSEETKEVRLINGCHLLICTPHSLLRMLERKVTVLNRLCHLVLEEADILTEEFTSQILQVMKHYGREMNEQKDLNVPRQKILCASRWTPGMREFARVFMQSPLIVVACRYEAAVYGDVQMTCTVCTAAGRGEYVVDLAKNVLISGHKMMVITITKKDAQLVHEIFTCASMYCNLVHDDLMDTELQQILSHWKTSHSKNSTPLIIITESMVDKLDLSDVACLVHYDPPTNQVNAGQRLWCMRKQFQHPLAPGKKKISNCVSHLFVTEHCARQAATLIRFLRRFKTPVPPQLIQLEKSNYLQQEHIKAQSATLCPYFKAFGYCRNVHRCHYRHIIIEKLDSPSASASYLPLPTEGRVKILVTNVEEANMFHARLLWQEDQSGQVSRNESSAKLMMDINFWFSKAANKVYISALPKEGELYAWEDNQHTFHRIQIILMSKIGSHGIPEKLEVRYVDKGGLEDVPTTKLLKLPTNLKSVAHQAVEVFLCRIKPPDEDSDWTDWANIYIAERVLNQELEGQVVLSLGNTLWVDPLVKREQLKTLDVYINELSVRTMMLSNKLAVENPQHMQLLYTACRDQITLPSHIPPELCTQRAYLTNGMLVCPHTAELDTEDVVSVRVGAVDTPDLFYVMNNNTIDEWRNLQDDIQTHVKMSFDNHYELSQLRENTFVLAKMTFDEQWYRGKVRGFKGEEVDVLFLDTGEQEYLRRCDLRPLPLSLLSLPFQAIECTLTDLQAIDGEWSDEVSDKLWDLTRTEDEGYKYFYAKVLTAAEARYSGQLHYGVTLVDTSLEYNISLGDYLVTNQLALLSTSILQELFGQEEDKAFTAAVSTECSNAKSARTQEEKAAFDNAIHRLESQARVQGEDEAYTERVIRLLCQMLRFMRYPRTVTKVIKSLNTLITEQPSSSKYMESHGGVNHLCCILDTATDEKLQYYISELFASMTTVESSVVNLLGRGALRILSNALTSVKNDQVCKQIVLTIERILQYESIVKDFTSLISSSVESMCKLINKTSNTVILSTLMITFERIGHHQTLKDAIRRGGGVKAICVKLETIRDSTVQECAVRCLTCLASNNRFSKDIMIEADTMTILKSLAQKKTLSGEVRDMSQKLADRLYSVLPSATRGSPLYPSHSPQKGASKRESNTDRESAAFTLPKGIRRLDSINNVPLPPELLSSRVPRCSKHPQVLWVQDRWNLMLTVKVADIPADRATCSEMVNYQPAKLTFRVVVEAVEYHFDFDLYELIEPDKCEMMLKSSELLLGLRKKTKGIWPRVLKPKHKLPYLTIDYHHTMVDSDSDDSETHEPVIRKPLSLALYNPDIPFSRAHIAHQNPPEVTESQVIDPDISDADSFDSDNENLGGKPYKPFEQPDPYNVFGCQ